MGGGVKQWRQNSVFLNLLVEVVVDVDYIEAVIRLLAKRYSDKIRRLNVATVEFTLTTKPTVDSLATHAYRFYCSNPTGYVLLIDIYQERRDPSQRQDSVQVPQARHGQRPHQWLATWATGTGWTYTRRTPCPHPSRSSGRRPLLWRRCTCYDLIPLHGEGDGERCGRGGTDRLLHEADAAEPAHSRLPSHCAPARPTPLRRHCDQTCCSLLSSSSCNQQPTAPTPTPTTSSQHWQLVESTRAPGSNTIGMVAWKVTLRTPEYPAGRELIVIANDITVQAGTFGPEEDILFDLASKYARQRGLPRLYVAANSGARIGLAEELRHKFRIAWVGGDVSKGVSYLYLAPSDYEQLKDSVIASIVTGEDGQQRYADPRHCGQAQRSWSGEPAWQRHDSRRDVTGLR